MGEGIGKALGKNKQFARKEGEVHRILAGFQTQLRRQSQMRDQAYSGVQVMQGAVPAEGFIVVQLRMVYPGAFDGRQVHARVARMDEMGQVSVVGHGFINAGRNGHGKGIGDCLPVGFNKPQVMIRGLEQDEDAGIAPGFYVHHQAGPLPVFRMVNNELRRPQQALFLPVGKQEQQVPCDFLALNGPQAFQQGGHGNDVIKRAGPLGDRVRMRHKNNGFIRVRRVHMHQDVVQLHQVLFAKAGPAPDDLRRGQVGITMIMGA